MLASFELNVKISKIKACEKRIDNYKILIMLDVILVYLAKNTQRQMVYLHCLMDKLVVWLSLSLLVRETFCRLKTLKWKKLDTLFCES